MSRVALRDPFLPSPLALVQRSALAGRGLDAWTADRLIEAYRFVRAGGTAATTDDVRRITGRNPIDFKSWARAYANAFRTSKQERSAPCLNLAKLCL